MDNIEKDVVAALRLGYGCQYGRYKVDYPNTADHSVDAVPDPLDDEPPRYCRNCGKMFTPRDGHQVFCTEECRLERRRIRERQKRNVTEKKPVGKLFCPICGRTAAKMTNKQIYCGKSCAATARIKARGKKV